MIGFAFSKIRRNLRFYLPFILLLIILTFAFSTLLALAIGSRQIYRKSGSEDLLAVFESNRACVMASLVPEPYKSRIEGLPHITDITGEVRHMIVYEPGKSLTIAGVEPEKFIKFKNIKIRQAEYADFERDPHGVIIGKKVQQIFNWEIGQTVTFQGLTFNVRGVFKMPLSVYNGMIVFHKEYMQKLVKKEGYFTAITIKIDSPANKNIVSTAVEQLCADHPAGISCKSETEFWGMTEKQMGDFGKNMRALTYLFAILLFVFIANATIFSLKDRGKEIEVLRMNGFNRGKIFTWLFYEPMAAVLIFSACGSFIAYFLWIKQPNVGGAQAIIPPIAVTWTVVFYSFIAITVFSAVIAAVVAYNQIQAKRLP